MNLNLYKGVCVETKEWVYGDLFRNSDFDTFIRTENGVFIEVFINSVGVYTKINDSLGNKLFEGDTVAVESLNISNPFSLIGVVKELEGRWIADSGKAAVHLFDEEYHVELLEIKEEMK